MGPARLVTAAAVLGLAVTGCGGGGETEGAAKPETPAGHPDRSPRDSPNRPARDRPPLRRAVCPAELAGCRAASGRILFVERVDPDGDGDAHFVLASGDSVTAPYVTVVDVRRDLRPRPLPGPGDRLSAAGPVFTGSYGQRQIEAVELFVARR